MNLGLLLYSSPPYVFFLDPPLYGHFLFYPVGSHMQHALKSEKIQLICPHDSWFGLFIEEQK